jgi:GDP-mannose 6-dehydrogenase
MTRVAVFGLGYVGTVSAACFAREGHDVVGVDVDADKVTLVSAGRSPVVEPGLEELVNAGRAAGRLRATGDVADAVASSAVALICVGTPSDSNGALGLRFVERVTREIGRAIRAANPSRYTVAYRSTMLPGTSEETLRPLLEAEAGRAVGPRLGLAMHPEFLREGTAIQDFFDPPKTVIGEADTASGADVAALYGSLRFRLERVPIRIAELVKYADNAFHAVKVAFANEVGNLAKRAGVDGHEVMRLFCLDTKLNLGPYYLKPGFAFGGSCLPKDLRAVIHHARRHDVAVPLLESAIASNDEHKRVALRAVQRWGRKRVGVLGLAFKAATDDLRESPVVELVETLLGRGYDIRIFDRNVALARLTGSNRAYIEREIPHLERLMVDSIDAVLAHGEVIVAGNADPAFAAAAARLRADQVLVDLVRVVPTPPATGEYYGLGW